MLVLMDLSQSPMEAFILVSKNSNTLKYETRLPFLQINNASSSHKQSSIGFVL